MTTSKRQFVRQQSVADQVTPLDFEKLQDSIEPVIQDLQDDPPYGSIYCIENAVATSLPTQSQWERVTTFNKKGLVKDMTADSDNAQVLVKKRGVYEIQASVSANGTVNAVMEFEAGINEQQTRVLDCHAERKLSGSGDIGSASLGPGRIRLEEGDRIQLYARCTSAGAATVTLRDANLTARWVGE